MNKTVAHKIKHDLILYMKSKGIPMIHFKNAYRKAKEAYQRGELC